MKDKLSAYRITLLSLQSVVWILSKCFQVLSDVDALETRRRVQEIKNLADDLVTFLNARVEYAESKESEENVKSLYYQE